MGEFYVSWFISIVPLTRISRNQNLSFSCSTEKHIFDSNTQKSFFYESKVRFRIILFFWENICPSNICFFIKLMWYFFRNGNWQLVKPCCHFCVWLKPVHLEPSTAQMENVSIVNFCAMVKMIVVMDQMNLTAPAIVNFIWNHLVISLVSWKKKIVFFFKSGIFAGFLPFWLHSALFLPLLGIFCECLFD